MTDYREFLLEQIERDTLEMRGLVEHFPPNRWDWRPEPEAWSAREHLHHARNVERRYLERLEGVLAHGEYVPAPKTQQEPGETSEEPATILEEYAALRGREVATLGRLTPDQWRHEFDHPTLWGRVSVEWWAERMVEHTTEHLQALWALRQLTAIAPERLKELAKVRF